MASHVALLRGINVGGRNKVPMADLREVVTSLGHTGVTTYIQSGNVLFTTGSASTGELAAALESAITDRFGIRASVVVLSRDDLARILHTPDGFGNSELAQSLFRIISPPAKEKRAVLAATARNWATATKLLALCDEK